MGTMRPAWMDGGPREKEMAAIVRQQLRRTLKRSWQTESQRSEKPFEQPNQTVASSQKRDSGFNVSGIGLDLTIPSEAEQPPIVLETIELGHLSQDFDCPTDFQTETLGLGELKIDTSSPLSLPNTTFKLPIIHDNVADLLMHYINKVFPGQYGIYCFFVAEHQRGWLLLLLMRSQSFFESCLALSAYHLSLDSGYETEDSHQNYFWHPHMGYRRSAMALLVQMLASVGLNGNIIQSPQKTEILGCVLQLNLLQIVQGGNENWEPLLNTIITFALPRPDLDLLGDKNTTICCEQGDISQQLDPSFISDDPASLFFTGMVIWFDILSCTSSRRMPEFSITHRPLMESPTPRIDMRKLVGCANWVLLCILDIIILDRWKYEQEAATTLSLIELTSRATAIESALDEGIRRFSDLIGNTESPADEEVKTGSESRDELDPDSGSVMRITTYIFACAAVVYLRTVTAGPNLRAPEVRQSVNKGVQAFTLINNFQHSRNLVWPFCIVGCLATREQENVFRKLVFSLETDPRTFGNFSKAFSAMEACWSERWSMDGTLRYCHWNTGMKKLNFCPLLV